MNDVKDLLEHLLEAYQDRETGEAGAEPHASALDELDEQPKTQDGSKAQVARVAIHHFLTFARQYLLEHPPQSHVMLHAGFGVQLAGGPIVSLVPSEEDTVPAGTLESGAAFHVTEGRSIRGQGGVQPGESFAVTGGKPEPYTR
jgi:hypothetical protein